MNKVVDVGDTSVRLKSGNITDESTDAIVNLNNSTLDQDFGVSKHILNSAGPMVYQECASLSLLPNDGCVVTGAGNLRNKFIIHLIDVMPTTITQFVKKSLKVCEHRRLRSISMPAIGTGTAQVNPQSSIRAIMQAIEEHVNRTTHSCISEIIIVAFDRAVYQEYLKFYMTYKVPGSVDMLSFCLMTSNWLSVNPPHSPPSRPPPSQPLWPNPTNNSQFTAFGKTLYLIKGDITDQAVDCIVNLANRTLNQKSGVSGAILAAAGRSVEEECKRIGVLNENGVVITSGGNTKAKNIMHIIGPTTVAAYAPSIDRILQACHYNGFKSVAVAAIGTGNTQIDAKESIYAMLKSILGSFSGILLPTLEAISIVVIEKNIYKTYLKVFEKESIKFQQRKEDLRSIHAKVIIDYPTNWTNPGINEHEEIPLDTTSAEYREVEGNFLKTSGHSYQVVQITRIQNTKLWQSFSLKKSTVVRNNPGVENVRHLYHGTSFDNIHNITHGGFNRIYCGKNGTVCGYGTYFAVNASYSCRTQYSPQYQDGCKRIFQAAVITGRCCQGNASLREPPYIDPQKKDQRYDSVVDNMQNITFFVVFYDDLSYPEYLITFKP